MHPPSKPYLRRSFPLRRTTYDSAVEFGARLGARMAGAEVGAGGILTNGSVGGETEQQKKSLIILAVGGLTAAALFVTGSPWLATGALGATLVGGAFVENAGKEEA